MSQPARKGAVAVGDPVDVATGAMFDTWLDFSVPGRPELGFWRFYSTSLRDQRGPLGPGWRHAYQHQLRRTLDGYAWTDDTGNRIDLPDRTGALARQGRLVLPDAGIELRRGPTCIDVRPYAENPRLTLRFETRDDGRTHRLLAIQRNDEVGLDMAYDGRGRLASITQRRSGRQVQLEYDRHGRLSATWFRGPPKELCARYLYDARGRLAQVQDRIGIVSTIEYDDDDRILCETTNSGAVHTFRYDGDGRCIYASGSDRYQERQLEYDLTNRITTVRDSHGHPTTYAYNDQGQVEEVVSALGSVAKQQFDDVGRPTRSIDPIGAVTDVRYDTLGRIEAATYPDGRAMTLEYDDAHRVTAIADAQDRRWEYTYDDTTGELLRSVNPLGHTWSYERNEYGEPVRVLNPRGHAAVMQWDRQGNRSSYTGPDGGTSTSTFDAYGRTVMSSDALGQVTQRQYDTAGRLARVQYPDGRVFRYAFPNGVREMQQIAPDGAVTRVHYNACGLVQEIVRPDGYRTAMEWDTEPRRLLRLRDGNDNTIEFQHDAMGRLVERTHWDDTVTRFEWDPMGRLLSLTNPEGGRFEYEHDDFGNMSMRRSPDGTETRYTHDVNGMMLSADDGTHRVEYERDLYGRVTTERVDGVAVDSEYDAVGARVGLRSDEGLDARYGFSPGNRCQTVEAGAGRIEFDYDIQGNEQRRRFGGGGVFQQRHDPMGRVVDQWFAPPGSDPQTPARHVEPDDPAAPFRRVFTYDAGGHISSMRDSLRGGWSFTHDGAGQLQSVTQIDGLTELFEYDGAGNRRGAARVPSDRAPGVEQSFVAGARGERNLDRQGLRQRGAELEEQTVGPGNRVTVVRRGATTLRYEFDALGRVVVKQRDDVEGTAVWRLTWNDTHQLVRLDNPAGETWTYDYDPLGRRLGKSDGTRTFAYTWDQDRLLHVRDDQGLHTIIEHPYLASTLMHLRDGAVEYVLPDPIGATSEVVRPDGTLARRRAQGPWGEARDEQPVVPFPGQLEDEESGLLYNQCRYYDPELGRYLSPDPIGLVGGLNDYSYVPSPMEWVDPDGLYITGGPYANPGGVPDPNSSTPRATGSDGTTRVTNPNTGNDNVVPPPSGTGRGGKTLAVLQDPNAPSDQVAFVSGHGRPDAPTRPGQGDWHTTNGPFGNWCHAEMHAAAWLLDNGHSLRGRTLDLVIDRPPCRHCNGSLRQAMDRLRADFGIDLRVRYFQHVDESASGGRTRGWHDFC